MTEKVMDMLYNHPWKGNIRELRNVLERAMILTKGDRITAQHVILHEPQGKPLGELNLTQVVELLMRDHRVGLEDLEKTYIQYAMEVAGNNVSQAARLLGLSRATLRYRLDKM